MFLLLSMPSIALAIMIAIFVATKILGYYEKLAPLSSEPQGERATFSDYHPILGYNGVPFKKEEFHLKLVTQNSRGDRSPEYAFAKPQGLIRILIEGDSQAWGFDVADDETIASKLESRLNQGRKLRQYQVINSGVSGYGSDQEFLKYVIEGREYRPDYVIVIFYAGNDFYENVHDVVWNVPKPRFVLRDEDLCLQNVPVRRSSGWPRQNAWTFLTQHIGWLKNHQSLPFLSLIGSPLQRFLSQRELRPEVASFLSEKAVWPFDKLFASSFFDDFAKIKEVVPCIREVPADEEDKDGGLEVTKKIFTLWKNVTQTNGASLLVFIVVSQEDFHARSRTVLLEKFRSFLIGENMFIQDTLGLEEVNTSKGPGIYYFGHLSACGSDLAAQEIERRILEASPMSN